MRQVETMLKETALAVQGVKHYGRGVQSYANVESKNYPRVWIHGVNPIDEVHQNGLITNVYEVVGEITTTIDYTSDIGSNEEESEKYLTTLQNIEGLYYTFISSLNRHPKNKRAIGRVTRKEILHEYDDNLVGYIFTFQIAVTETVTYQCL
jgi:hypothetical protein